MIRTPRANELEEVVAFIAAQQARSERRDAMFDEHPGAIAVQLSGWETPWTEISRVADRGQGLVGFIGAELDDSLGRIWIHGPVVDDPDWECVADELLAALELREPRMAALEAEIAADVANERIAAFAARHGFVAGKVHHLLALDASAIEDLPRPSLAPLAKTHEHALVALHEQLFPGTYYSGGQLLAQASRGDAIVLGLTDEAELTGYVAGRIDEAGDGYVDFVGVIPDKRRRGFGETLMAAIAHALRDQRPITTLRLTVSGENVGALALYGRLGFVRQSSAVGYRRPPEPGA